MAENKIKTTHPVLIFWIVAGWVGYCLLPWFMVEDGIWSFEWLVDGYPFDPDYAPALFLIAQAEKLWLSPLLIPLALPLFALGRPKSDPMYARILILAGALGFGWLIAQGFSIGIRGLNFEWQEALLGDLKIRQFGMGYGAMICASAFLFLLTSALAPVIRLGYGRMVILALPYTITMTISGLLATIYFL